MQLFHFSEEPDIAVFEPRKLDYRMDEPAQVWTIDYFHAPHYYFPRDCPRVCIWAQEDTTDEDLQRFFGHSNSRRMVAVESGWLERIRRATIYRYIFDPDEFEIYELNAGYYTTTRAVKPVAVEKLDDLLGSLTALDIEVRITPSLRPLKEDIPTSTVNYSMIRMKYAIL
ncbi:MAG: hypothetical protein K0R75_911 [Paenibacillaceae bacterium]|jgi:hypothetical protein|nr:hypothetical protein [Paenibacillaceae bacterium]